MQRRAAAPAPHAPRCRPLPPQTRNALSPLANNQTTNHTTKPKQGYPIFVERLGALDARAIERAGLDERRVLEYHVREMEFMAQVTERLGD